MLQALLAVMLTAAPKQVIAVLDLKAHEGISVDLAQSLTEQLVFAVRDQAKGVRVIGSADVASLLGFEKQRTMLGCADSSCLAELGGAMGATQIITGSLAMIGDQYVLALRRISTEKATVLGQTLSRVPKSDIGKLSDLLSADVRQLFDDLSPRPPVPEAAVEGTAAPSPRHSRVLPLTLGAGAILAAGLSIVGWYEVGNYYSVKGTASTPAGAVPVSRALGAANSLTWGEPLAIASTAVALALLGGTIWTW